MPRSTLLVLLLLALIGWALHSGRIAIPEAWNPWAPLRIDAPANWLTRYKLSRASADPMACRAALAQADMTLVPLDDRVTGEGCGLTNAVRVERTSVGVGEAFSLSCRAALSLAMWERHDLQQAAVATADAIDIAGFVLEDGRRVRVLTDWVSRVAPEGDVFAESRGDAASGPRASANAATGRPPPLPDTPESRFLHAARDGACRWFDAVLGPDYNQAHADHFHFDRGRARICR